LYSQSIQLQIELTRILWGKNDWMQPFPVLRSFRPSDWQNANR
jgi:hypothetical protein